MGCAKCHRDFYPVHWEQGGLEASLGVTCGPTLGTCCYPSKMQEASFPVGGDEKASFKNITHVSSRPAYLTIHLGFSFRFL